MKKERKNIYKKNSKSRKNRESTKSGKKGQIVKYKKLESWKSS